MISGTMISESNAAVAKPRLAPDMVETKMNLEETRDVLQRILNFITGDDTQRDNQAVGSMIDLVMYTRTLSMLNKSLAVDILSILGIEEKG